MPTDVTQFLRGLEAAQRQLRAAAIAAVDQFAEHVLGDAQQLAPVDTGALKASGSAQPAELHGNLVQATIGFNTDYAAAVHERITARHKQGQSKYLETAMQNNAPKFGPFMAGRLRGQ
jgi:hypothetical protein